jgi:predicted GIY-YIG superfamily endonuclease
LASQPAEHAILSLEMYFYVYLLVSIENPEKHYVGLTRDLDDRLRRHNAGEVPHASKYLPWRIETVVAFRSHAKAIAFERYLKSGSGREFSRRHF